MATEILMPKLGFIMTEGTILEWLKQPGDLIEKGEPILVVETEKVAIEVEAPAAGIMGPILAQPGTTVPVAETIGYILEPGEELPPVQAMFKGTIKAPIKASPVAKRLASEHGIDLSSVKGSGPAGRIVKRDVQAHIEEGEKIGAPPPAPVSAAWETRELTSIQKLAAERMTQSFGAAPHFYLSVDADVGEVVAVRDRLLASIGAKTGGIRVSYTDILVKSVARAIGSHPLINAVFERDHIKVFKEINIGVAVDTPDGLVVPVIHGANGKSLTEICRLRAELVEKAKSKKLNLDDLSGGTFTLSNLGMFDIDVFNAIINPPQAAILAVGKITEKPVVVNGEITVKPKMWLTLSVDHRVADGATAARFLQTLVSYLEEPYQLIS
jgi:pyruvate dehydrogenase E2 component (dihydrolipoamide acetyltransferase)